MRIRILKLTCFFFLLSAFQFCAAQKTDKVFLRNGDGLTGEIKSLKFAKLGFNMTGPGLIQIKWEEVVSLHSDKTFQATMRRGEVLITKLDSNFFNTSRVTLDDIVEIEQIKDRFIKRLEGDINMGFNYAKSNQSFQFNFSNTTTYRKPKEEFTFKLNTILTHNSADTVVSKKQDAGIEYYRKLKNSFYINSLLGWQKNTQLGLNNRFLITGGAGKRIINTNNQRLLTGTGLSYNMEQSNKGNNYSGNLEALAVIQYKKYRYSSPKISLDVQYIIYPGISDWGRIRMDFQVAAKLEIFKDFFVGLNFYDLYDNRPPSVTGTKNDFGINFTLGYEFGK